jgi:hypothetical protein
MGSVCSGELKHYGVLGMKWGTRRAAMKDTNVVAAKSKLKAENKKFYKHLGSKEMKKESDKEFDDKVNKVISAEKSYKNAYKKAKTQAVKKMISEGYDAGAAKRIAGMSTAKAMTQSFLMGSYGAMKYNEFKAKGTSTGKSIAKAIMLNWGNNMTYGQLGRNEQVDNMLKRYTK